MHPVYPRSVGSPKVQSTLTAKQSVLEDIQSEVQNGRRNERNSASREGNVSLDHLLQLSSVSDLCMDLADHTSDYLEHGVMPSRRRPASDLSSAIHGQSYSMRHPAIPEHRAVANADGEPLSRHTSRTESVYSGYGRDHQDADSMYGSLPSLYGSPTLSISKMATQPIAIPANQRRPSGVSEGSENSFDDMYGCQQSPRLAGPQSCATHRALWKHSLIF